MRKQTKLIVGAMTMILGLQIAAAYTLSLHEQPPAAPALHAIPSDIGTWRLAGEEAMDPDVAAYLKPDDYIDRNYGGTGGAARVNLFVAYFKSLKSGYGPHSPGICLPSAGWKPKQNDLIQLDLPSESRSLPINEYVLEKNNENLLVLYWYQNERHVWAEEFRAKLFMLPDLLRYHRSDAALVRIIAPVNAGSLSSTRAELFEFVRSLFPSLARQFHTIG